MSQQFGSRIIPVFRQPHSREGERLFGPYGWMRQTGIDRESNILMGDCASYDVRVAIRSNSPLDAERAVREAQEMLADMRIRKAPMTEDRFDDSLFILDIMRATQAVGADPKNVARAEERFRKSEGDEYTTPRVVWKFVVDHTQQPQGRPRTMPFIYVQISTQDASYAIGENDRVVDAFWEAASALMQRYETGPFVDLVGPERTD